MAAICAFRPAEVDVKLPLQIAALDSSIGQKVDLWRRLCPRSDFRPAPSEIEKRSVCLPNAGERLICASRFCCETIVTIGLS